ncbi:MAG: putative lipid II flippase FtsW [Austwickia sp.]|nr:putative lipid II flippase FtsW [Austwickia sp.]MBK8435736.1 putative lipid II flippase FtsW [Austwickia sp.]MBK9100703.1 putative lipid II flippase FtsW [Austwickia sp.]
MSTPTKSAASWPTWFRLPTSVLARGGSGTRGAGGESARPGGSTPSGRPAPAGGRPPEPHPVWSRLDSPLSTYYLLIGSAGMLLVIGLVMVLSASSVGAMSKQGDPYAVFANQARYAVVGLGFAWIAARIPVELWKRAAVPLLLGATTLQLLVFTPLGFEVNGNRNWLRLGIQLQPSELGKLGIILFAATVFSAKRRLLHDWKHAVIPVVAPCGILLVGLVMAGRDLGTALILLLILFGVLWAAGVTWRVFAVAGVAAAGVVALLVVTSNNRMSRLASFLNCEDVKNQCWQAAHGSYALADGGLLGRGLGASREKWNWLPEPHNDFIFPIIGEELGLGGTLIVLLLFACLALACYRIVMHTHDLFIRVATAGVMVWILGQAIINIGAAIGVLPVIGVPLPLVSSGGSALMTVLTGLGMVVSFARSEPRCRKALATRARVLPRTLSVLSASRPRWADARQRRSGNR